MIYLIIDPQSFVTWLKITISKFFLAQKKLEISE
jgi:hypothetical protein